MEKGVGRLAGYGIFPADTVAIAAHMPLNYRQTTNAAELMAAPRALQIFQTGEIAICTDSQYVILVCQGLPVNGFCEDGVAPLAQFRMFHSGK